MSSEFWRDLQASERKDSRRAEQSAAEAQRPARADGCLIAFRKVLFRPVDRKTKTASFGLKC